MKLIHQAIYECSLAALDSGDLKNEEDINHAVDIIEKAIKRIRGCQNTNSQIVCNTKNSIIKLYKDTYRLNLN